MILKSVEINLNKDKGVERKKRNRPLGHPEAFCVIHPPEFVQDLSGVSALQFPFPSGKNQVTVFSTWYDTCSS